jgi:flagellar hook assembly protein FlgD
VTTISFNVPQGAGHVSLNVYGVDGRHIRSLADGVMAAGPHALTWDGRDEKGRPLPSGIYFARLSTEHETRGIKMTLLK